MGAGYPTVLRKRPFLLLISGQFTSQLGNLIGYMAVMALLYQMTGSSLLIGTYMAAQAVAGLLMGPLAGALADRSNRLRTMVVSDLLRAGLVLALLFVRSPWQVLLIAMAKSAVAAFFTPAKAGLVPSLLADDELNAGFSLEQTLQSTGQIVGPALGGAAVILLGLHGAFVIDAATFLVSCLSIMLLPYAGMHEVAPSTARAGASRSSLLKGYREVLAVPAFARLAVLKAISLVGTSAINVVLIAYAYQVLKAGNFGYGLVTSCLGAGALVGSLINGTLLKRVRSFAAMGVSAIAVGLLVSGAGLTAVPAVAYGLFLLAGAGIGIYNVNFAVSLQRSVGPEYLGRAVAGSSLVDNVIILLTLAGGGFLADSLGVRPVLAGGALLIAVAGAVALRPVRAALKASDPVAHTKEVLAVNVPEETVPTTVPGATDQAEDRPEPAKPAGEPAAQPDSNDRPRIRRVGVTVHDQSGRPSEAAAAVDGGENSISIGYDGGNG